ncbi:hypothetical protein GPL15_15190 [Clostridium sp. MCC353]|uniref:hypothetical protein n=1 Tax=Clostridium sp. MCC353 TaxID=2592646 RepID=UPI001C02F765|nr:hypothetical protein [Clostridium sp. MCC353]MBT9777847.1 hypothetical protein [Clostridium sp. MCC353]
MEIEACAVRGTGFFSLESASYEIKKPSYASFAGYGIALRNAYNAAVGNYAAEAARRRRRIPQAGFFIVLLRKEQFGPMERIMSRSQTGAEEEMI